MLVRDSVNKGYLDYINPQLQENAADIDDGIQKGGVLRIEVV